MVIEWTGIIFILILLVLDLLTISIIDRIKKLNGELKRKLFHITMGLSMLALPYIFSSIYSVLVLAVLAIISLLIIKHTKFKNSIGSVLYSVERQSWGEIFFVISVFVIFYLSRGNKILYNIPILTLTLADSVAALIGKRYGKNNISYSNEDTKSIEGSFMFFITAFMITIVNLLLFTNVGRQETLIISIIIGFNVALVEMISHSGNDNLLIPLTSYAFLAAHINLDVNTLITSVIIIAILFLISITANKIKAFSKMTVAEVLVIGYLMVILYGVYAIFPPLMVYIASLRFPKRREHEKKIIYDARIVETNALVGLVIAGLASITENKCELYMLYSLAFSMHLAINSYVRFKYYLNYSTQSSIMMGFIKGLIFVFIPCIGIQYIMFKQTIEIGMIILSLILLAISCIAIMVAKKDVKEEEISMKNAYLHMKIVAVLSSIMLIVECFVNPSLINFPIL